MFENRNGLSSDTTVSSHASAFFSRKKCASFGRDVARQPDMTIDRVLRKENQISPRQPFEEARHVGFRNVRRPVCLQRGDQRLIAIDDVVAVAERHVIVRVDVQPPQQLFFPGGQRLRADGADVAQREQHEHLQLLFGAEHRRELPHDFGLFGVAAERDPRHLQMVADEKVDGLRGVVVEAQTAAHHRTPSRRRRSEWSPSRALPTS